MPAAIGAHYTPVLATNRDLRCQKCRKVEPIPKDPATVVATDRPRWEQFFHGGPLFCRPCFAVAAACGECGWHLTRDQLSDHVRREHRV